MNIQNCPVSHAFGFAKQKILEVQDLLLRGVEFLENLSPLGKPEGFKVQGLKFKVQECTPIRLL